MQPKIFFKCTKYEIENNGIIFCRWQYPVRKDEGRPLCSRNRIIKRYYCCFVQLKDILVCLFKCFNDFNGRYHCEIMLNYKKKKFVLEIISSLSYTQQPVLTGKSINWKGNVYCYMILNSIILPSIKK